MKRVLIIGGVAAGMKAAATARRRSPSLDIVVMQDEAEVSYSACGTPYHLGDPQAIPRAGLVARGVDRFREDGIDLRIRHRVQAVDLAARRASVTDLAANRDLGEPFDEILFATGAEPVMPRIPTAAGAPPVVRLRSLADADRLRQLIPAIRRAVIVGGGYIGLEMAEALALRGIAVTVVEAMPRLLGAFDPLIGDAVAAHLAGHRVELRLGTGAAAVAEEGVCLADGQALAADLVLIAAGIRPRVDLAVAAGVGLGVTGAIAVDARMRTGAEGVYAAGDCAEARHRVSGQPVWYPLGDVANRQGRVAGVNLAGGQATFPGVLGTAIFRVFELAVARTGLSEAQARQAGFDPVRVHARAPSRARYMPQSRPLDAILVADRRGGRVLGGEAVGPDGVDKLIDVVATAVWAGLAVDDLAELDLAYAPPYAPVFAPVQVAAELARKQVDRPPASR